MESNRNCKGCSDEYRVTDDRIRATLASPMFDASSGNCVPDEVYEARLKLCHDCSKLISGHTCSLCGCIVPVIAKLKVRSCPRPDGTGWQRYSN